MRWLLVILVVANLALFIWLEQSAGPKTSVPQLPPPDVGRLQIVGPPTDAARDEAAPGDDAVVTAATAPSASPPGPAGPPDDATVAPPALASPAPEPAGREQGVGGDPRVAAATAPGPEPAAAPSSPEHEDSPPSVPADDALTTGGAAPLSESESAAGVDGAAGPGAEEPQAIEQPAPATAVCGRAGPLTTGQADALLERLPVFVTLLSDVTEESETNDGYYVLIPQLPTMAEGQKKVAALKAAGITDIWLIRGGDLQRSISLGVFSGEAGAQRRVRDVAKKGFEAEILPRTSRTERRWLTLKNVDGGDLALSLPLPAGVGVETRDCP